MAALLKSYQQMDPVMVARSQEISLPHSYWSVLSPEDRTEFIRLRSSFLQGQKISSKDRRTVTFRKELISVLKYIERSSIHTEERSVLVGVCFAGPFICVNTRQLKNFLGRCKSSINGSFQQMGYVALRTKAKARSCVVAVMPSLQNEQNILRQWTVRCASEDAQFCFISSFAHVQLPTITEDDLYDEKRSSHRATTTNAHSQFNQIAPVQYQQFLPMKPQQMYIPQQMHQQVPIQPRQVEFDLPDLDDPGQLHQPIKNYDLAQSMSVDTFSNYGSNDGWNDDPMAFDSSTFDWDGAHSQATLVKPMARSSSLFLPAVKDWDFFADF